MIVNLCVYMSVVVCSSLANALEVTRGDLAFVKHAHLSSSKITERASVCDDDNAS